jgi:hypothetical protein
MTVTILDIILCPVHSISFGPVSSVFSVAVENLKIRIYKTIILPVALYGCETWSLTLREEPLIVFENRVLRRILVTREWRKLHNEELHDLYSSPSIIRVMKSRRMRWAGHVARMGEKRNACKFLVGKRPLGRPRRMWVDNIRMDLVDQSVSQYVKVSSPL